MKAVLQPGYVLHSRPYRDSSLILEYFSRDMGRVSLVAKGAKGRKTRGGSVAALLQPFSPLLCSWSGRSELKTLTDCEAAGEATPLTGRRLYSGLYVNELLVRLLHHEDPHHQLYERYAMVLGELGGDEPEEMPLRRFEFTLLEELGYGFDLQTDGVSGEPVKQENWYSFHEEYGLVLADTPDSDRLTRYRGVDLLQLVRGEFSPAARRCAKRLMRQALAAHLGEKPLKSRELFQRPTR
jgi:DNA repair protein RecO (recombination protein O)